MFALTRRFATALILPTLALAAPAGAQIIDLGNLGNDGFGDSYSVATGINNQSQIVGYSTTYDSSGNALDDAAFLYSGGKLNQLNIGFGPDLIPSTHATSINNAGQIVGFSNLVDASSNDRGQAAWIYQNGKVTQLGNFGTSFAGTTYTVAEHINNQGQVVGFSNRYDAGGNYQGAHSFLYSNGQMNDLGDFGHTIANASFNQAPGINDAGQIIVDSLIYGKYGNIAGQVAYLYQNGNATDLGNFGVSSSGQSSTFALAINNAGQVVGGSEVYDQNGNDLGYAAFLYQNGQRIDLGNLGVDVNGLGFSRANAINDLGQIVGISEAYDAQGNDLGTHGFLYRNGQMIDLDTRFDSASGWSNLQPLAINDHGLVVGAGTYNGNTEAFLLNINATPVPEPGAWATLAAIGLSGANLLVRRRPRR